MTLISICWWVLLNTDILGTLIAAFIGIPLWSALFTSIVLLVKYSERKPKKKEADKTEEKGGEYLDII
jgi:hypothetical protein